MVITLVVSIINPGMAMASTHSHEGQVDRLRNRADRGLHPSADDPLAASGASSSGKGKERACVSPTVGLEEQDEEEDEEVDVSDVRGSWGTKVRGVLTGDQWALCIIGCRAEVLDWLTSSSNREHSLSLLGPKLPAPPSPLRLLSPPPSPPLSLLPRFQPSWRRCCGCPRPRSAWCSANGTPCSTWWRTRWRRTRCGTPA
jgi:hypothetical protein